MGVPLDRLPDWPASLDRQAAMAFTGVSETKLREWVKLGKVRFRPIGQNAAMVALRSELEVALRAEFTGATLDAAEDLDFD